MIEIVGERLTPREMLAEIRQTAAERVPPSVDDLGIAQDQLDQRHVEPIVRQLVDEERPIGAALHACALEIFLTERAPLVRRRLENAAGIRTRLARQERQIG